MSRKKVLRGKKSTQRLMNKIIIYVVLKVTIACVVIDPDIFTCPLRKNAQRALEINEI